MAEILIAVACLGAIGLLLAIILYITSKKFAVYSDPRIAQIQEILPNANCGGCGYSGCGGFAEACVKSGEINRKYCPVGGELILKKVAEILNLQAPETKPLIAVVRCQGGCMLRPRINHYDGASSCAITASLYGGETACSWGCLGCGDCVKVCQFEAIRINRETLLPEIDEESCTACGACAKVCPKDLIEIRSKGPRSCRVYVGCVNQDRGTVVSKGCAVACIGCGKCVKTCTFDAITLENNLAYIDSEKCRMCGECVEACSRKSILALHLPIRKEADE